MQKNRNAQTKVRLKCRRVTVLKFILPESVSKSHANMYVSNYMQVEYRFGFNTFSRLGGLRFKQQSN